MIMNFVVVLLIVVILYSLISAAIAMVRHRNNPERMAKALTWRVSLSLALFVLVIVSFLMGWVEPKRLFSIPDSPSLKVLHTKINIQKGE